MYGVFAVAQLVHQLDQSVCAPEIGGNCESEFGGTLGSFPESTSEFSSCLFSALLLLCCTKDARNQKAEGRFVSLQAKLSSLSPSRLSLTDCSLSVAS